MKNFLTIIVLLTFLTGYIKCGAIGKHDVEIDEPEPKVEEPGIIDKIKSTTGDFIGKVQHGTEVAVQKLKDGFQETKCRLHIVGNKLHEHTHKHNPCGDHVETEGKPGENKAPHNVPGGYGGPENKPGENEGPHNVQGGYENKPGHNEGTNKPGKNDDEVGGRFIAGEARGVNQGKPAGRREGIPEGDNTNRSDPQIDIRADDKSKK